MQGWNTSGIWNGLKFEQAIQLDSSFALAYMYNAISTNPFRDWNIYKDMNESNTYIQQAFQRSASLPFKDQLMVQMIYEQSIQNPNVLNTMKQLLEIDPDNQAAINMLSGSTMFSGKAGEKNIDLVENYLIRNPKDHGMWNNIAYTYMNEGLMEEAKKAIDQYLELRPNLYNSYHSSWDIYLMAGDFEKAFFYAEQLKRKFTKSNHGVWVGITNLVIGNGDEALKTYHLYKDSTTYFGLQSLGFDSYLIKGKVKKSLVLVDEVVDRYQSLGENKTAATIALNKPFILLSFQRYDEAIRELDKLISSSKGDTGLTVILFMAEYYKGICYILMGDFQKAAEQVNVIKLLRTSGNTDNRYDLYIRLLDAELALAQNDLEKVNSSLDGDNHLMRLNNPKYYTLKIAYLIRNNKFSEALEILDNINRQLLSGRYSFGGNPTIYTINLMFRGYYRGIVYEKLNQPKEALEAYGAFLELLKDSDPGIKEKEDAERRVRKLRKRVATAL